MKLTHPLLFVLTLLLVSGCALNSVKPYDGGDEGLVVLGMDVSTTPGNTIWYDYLFTVKNLDTDEYYQLRATPWVGDDYEILGTLPAGHYGFFKRKSVRKGGQYLNPHSMNWLFEVKPGQVSIPFRLEVRSTDKGQYFKNIHLTHLDREELYDTYLAPRSDMAGWTLKE